MASSATAKHEILLEYSALGQASHCPLGMYILPLGDNPFVWHGVLFIHRSYYASSILRFTLTIPSSYPSTAPTVHFQGTVFHPLIDPGTGKFRLENRFPSWRPREDFLFHVLHCLKSSFKRRALDELREGQCANREAYRLYRDQTPLFAKLASQSAALSISDQSLFGPQAHINPADGKPSPIRFRKLKDGEEEQLRKEVEDGARKRLLGSVGGNAGLGLGVAAK